MPTPLSLTLSSLPAGARQPVGTTLVVYAPLGENTPLTRFQDDLEKENVGQHPLGQSLLAVAALGVNTVALVDRIDGSTWLQTIPAFRPEAVEMLRFGTRNLRDPAELMSFVVNQAARLHPGTALVLALEGHGTGFMPVVLPPGPDAPPLVPPPRRGIPLLGMGSPLLPGDAPLATSGLRNALDHIVRSTGQRLAAVHLNNCFNLSIEVLHTIAPFAEVATGYLNYNFFSAGRSYANVFQRVAKQRGRRATTAQLARWFAEANRDHLALLPQFPQPTAGGAVELTRLPGIVAALDRLAAELVVAMTATAKERSANVAAIAKAIARAWQYDTEGDLRLDGGNDAHTDLDSFALQLAAFDGANAAAVKAAASDLHDALAGIFVYGVSGSPVGNGVPPGTAWNLDRPDLALSVFCPDPARRGLWDWRSPYYLHPGPPDRNPSTIPFLLDAPNWLRFITEYHRDVTYDVLLPVPRFRYPVAAQ